jgi:hypothetical protein
MPLTPLFLHKQLQRYRYCANGDCTEGKEGPTSDAICCRFTVRVETHYDASSALIYALHTFCIRTLKY